jgi:hypothetical protein
MDMNWRTNLKITCNCGWFLTHYRAKEDSHCPNCGKKYTENTSKIEDMKDDNKKSEHVKNKK